MATGYWRGADNANWSTGTNWFDSITGPTTLTDATVPGAGNIAFFNANGTTTARTVYLNAPAGRSIGTFWMNGNAQGDITLRGGVSGGETTQTLTLGGIDMSGTSANSVWASSVSVALANNNSWNIGSGRAILVNGVVSGAFKLTSNNSGVIILGNANTYSGGTDISAGTVRAGNNQALGAGAGSTITMTGGKLSSSSTTGYTLANALSLTGTVTLGDATNNGALTFSGTTTIAGNTTLNLEAGNFMTFSGAIAGTGSWTMSRGTSTSIVGVKLTGPSGGTLGAVTANANVVLFLADYNSGTPNQLANAASITANCYNFQIAGNTAYTFTQAISGSTTLYSWNSHVNGITFNNFSGWSGAVEMIGDTTYAATQKITVASAFSFGTLRFSPTNAVALATQTFAYAGANANTSSTALSINSQGVSTGVVAIVENGSSNLLTISGQATHAASSAAVASTLRFATTSGNITYSGNIVEGSTGTLNLSKTGSNTLTLSGSTSTYKGTVQVTAGTLNANSTTALGAASSTAGISVSSGATLSLGAALNYSSSGRSTSIIGTGVSTGGALVHAFAGTANVGAINLGGAAYIRGTASGTSILSSAITATTGPLTVGAASSNVLTLSGAISSNLTVTVANSSADTGEVLLSGVNGSLTGAITVNYGTLSFATQSAVGFAGTLTLTRFGTVVQFNSGTSTNRQITGRGEIRLKAAGAYAFGQINMPTGDGSAFGGNALGLTAYENATLTSGVYWPSTVYVSELYPKAMAGKTLTLQGVLDSHPSSSPYVYFIPEATGKVIISGSNTYNGISFISSGTTQVAAPESAGVSGPFGINTTSGAIQMFNTGVLQYSASNNADYSGRFDTTGGEQWRIDTNGQSVTFASALQGAGSLVEKLGTGTLRFTGTNTYTGSTSVSAGTLAAGNTQAFGTTGTVTLTTSGATLQTLTTGMQNGKLTVAALTNSAGGIIKIGG